MGLSIRRAALKDVNWLLPQLKDFSEFFGSRIPLFQDVDDVRVILTNMISGHPFFIAELDDKPVGFISGHLAPHGFNPKIKVLSETFWWVAPEHRGSKAGAMLLDNFVAFGKQNADWVTFTLEHKSPVPEEILIRRGFQFQEKSYLMETR